MDTIIMYDLMIAANELKFEELSVKLENYLIESKASCVIFESAEFISLHESALVFILKRDDFQMKESEIKDGFTPITFWNICHGHDNTIATTKVERTNGFNPLAWDKTKNDGRIQNSILSRVRNENSIIFSKIIMVYVFANDEFMMKLNWCCSSINKFMKNLLKQLMMNFLL
ncbi:hypothetical protein Glove_750g37 [Diversispora epigaea]|uniref:Uncharacterized protein n=1 Tax=Diversispora epigaea TaxID=1348612 RepID=A0A397FZM4_9GLOM|nr:hypothetical protein Glove_750g37 [Diversispora epigaea]